MKYLLIAAACLVCGWGVWMFVRYQNSAHVQSEYSVREDRFDKYSESGKVEYWLYCETWVYEGFHPVSPIGIKEYTFDNKDTAEAFGKRTIAEWERIAYQRIKQAKP